MVKRPAWYSQGPAGFKPGFFADVCYVPSSLLSDYCGITSNIKGVGQNFDSAGVAAGPIPARARDEQRVGAEARSGRRLH